IRRLAWPAAVWLGAAAVLAVVWYRARHAAATAQSIPGQSTGFQVDYATGQLLLGLVFIALALAAAALLYWAPGSGADPTAPGARRWSLARFGAAGLLPVLVATQALTLAVPFYPRTGRDTFYPATDVQTFLAANLGQQRFAGTWTAMFMGSESPRRLRALTGHGFINEDFAALVRAIPDNPINYPTYLNLTARPEVAHSPVLDTLGVRYLVTSPRDPVFGTPHNATSDGGSQQLRPGATVTVPVPEAGPLRAVGFTPAAAYTPPAGPAQARDWVAVTIRDASGATVASAQRLTLGIAAGQPFLVPVAADRVAAGTRLTAEFTLHTAAPLTVATAAGPAATAPTALAVDTVSGGDDGLSLAHAGSSVIWDRLTAQPRIRWASRAIVEPDQQARIGLLAGGVPADQVVLDAPGPAADGRPASVQTTDDGTDRISTTVDAQGSGYLVVADADQVGWAATVDGRGTSLVHADQGVVAVPVPAGRHTVTLHYAAPYGNSGTWITVVAIVLLVAAAGATSWRRRVETG
ncbi:MAG: YfhO family protein, partial [Micromonosporaceae bacterium]|nr:YfhO family protein [Micromonosporaceae bacterium]